jgi:hypothetical protein
MYRFRRFVAPSKVKRKRRVGIISEGISQALFGRATVPVTKERVSIAPSRELLEAGISSPSAFIFRGGFLGRQGSGKLPAFRKLGGEFSKLKKAML